jgi:hypothetical protein
MLEDFLTLSRILTGVETLDPELGAQYLDRLMSSPWSIPVQRILERLRSFHPGGDLPAQVQQTILPDDTLRPAVCQIVLLWYTSALRDNSSNAALALRYGDARGYFSGLVWRLLGAHQPGLSGGYFGHWHYRPDNEPAGRP